MTSFEFYIHYENKKVLCRVNEEDDVYKIYFDDVYITDMRYDHHGKWFQTGGTELSYETLLAVGDGIDSYYLSHGI